MHIRVLTITTILLLLFSNGFATTWYVTPDGSGDASTIQAAVDLCESGDVIQLEHGIYSSIDGVGNDPVGHGSGRPVCVALKSGVTIRGDLENPDLVVIDAANSGGVVFCASVSSVVVEGLSIVNGSTDVVWNGSGGGVYCTHSDLVLNRCRIIGNSSPDHGGGLHVFMADISIIDCYIENNFSEFTGSGAYFSDSSVLVEGTVVSGNWIINGGALPLYSGGGGFYFSESDLQVTRCTFSDNTVDSGGGGGINCYSGNTGSIESSLFEGNEASWGGGLRVWSNSSIDIVDCSIHLNSASIHGGALSVSNSTSFAVINTDFVDTSAPVGADGFIEDSCTVVLECCITSPSDWAGYGSWVIEDDGCSVRNDQISWGTLKHLFR